MAGEIIGRREELQALEAFLEAVPAGGQALLLEGDAGIGKSALWSEGLNFARERKFRVLTARSLESLCVTSDRCVFGAVRGFAAARAASRAVGARVVLTFCNASVAVRSGRLGVIGVVGKSFVLVGRCR
jgi:AAA ATPase domain